MRVQATPRSRYLEIVAITEVVTAPKLIHLVDILANELERDSSRNVLVDVRARSRDIPLFETFSIFAHMMRRRVTRTKIAYVVTGRARPSITRIYEDISARCGVKIKFFAARKEALDWLDVAEESIGAESSEATL